MIYYDFKNKMIKFIFLLFYVKQITNENTTREKNQDGLNYSSWNRA